VAKQIRVNIRGRWYNVQVGKSMRGHVEAVVDGEQFVVELDGGKSVSADDTTSNTISISKGTSGLRGIVKSGEKLVRSPMPGTIVAMSVDVGQTVQEGDEICMLETMKMEQSIRFNTSGTVKKLLVKPSDSVQTSSPLLELD